VPSFGTTLAQREKNWKLGGYKIYTSLNLALQDDAQLIEHEWVPSYLPTMDIGGSTVSVQVGTGRILVMAENRTFNQSLKGGSRGTTAINYAVDQKYGGSAYGFQGGSTYKPFTLINWLQHGHGLEDVLNATPDPNLDLSRFKDRCEPGGWGGKYGRYTNDEGEKGPFTVLRATAQSVNGIFLQMGAQLDQCDTRDDAEAFGVHQGHTGLALQHQPSAILGTNSVAPLTMAAAYAGIANHGVFCKPTAIDSVVAPDGKALAGQAKSCSVAISPDLDAAVGYAMEGVFSAGTAGAARPPGVNILGKTGTTNNSVQTWTVGATTKVATAVWIGNATGQVAARRTLPPRQCPGTADQVATLRNCVFKYTMESIDAAKGYAPGSFPTAPAQYLNGNTKPLPDFAGQTVNSATAQLQALNFTVTVHSGMVHSAQPAGTVAYTDPSAGTKISSGYQVTIYVSDGSETMTIPDVTGESWFQASNDIESAGFVPPQEVCTATLNPGQEGKVLSTDPIAGWQGPGATVIKVDVGQFGADPCP
jgi:membrane peptidoglycan carboxypeptidase